MHADELDIDADLVRRLLCAQFPKWEDLAVSRVPDAGTDNALYRLGEDMVVLVDSRHQIEHYSTIAFSSASRASL